MTIGHGRLHAFDAEWYSSCRCDADGRLTYSAKDYNCCVNSKALAIARSLSFEFASNLGGACTITWEARKTMRLMSGILKVQLHLQIQSILVCFDTPMRIIL
jgi:hypothetical protein